MKTAVDSNVLFDVLRPNPAHLAASRAALSQAAAAGELVISEAVYAETGAHFKRHKELEAFLADAGIRLENSTAEACFRAAQAWRTYRSRGGPRARMLADFLIGAHAELQAGRLLSRDRDFYLQYFPRLHVPAI
jgi:predicted nucleic acid-binding protein